MPIRPNGPASATTDHRDSEAPSPEPAATPPGRSRHRMSRFPDPIAEGLARGWKVVDAGDATLPGQLDCDVAIVGTGAGGGITAEILARAGLRVVMKIVRASCRERVG